MARVVGSNDRICVTCLRDVEKVAFFWEPTHVLSLLDPCLPSEKSPKLEKAKHIVLRMYDQEDTGATGHFSSIIERAYEQLSSIFAKPKNKVLIHCHAGVSRSTSFAYAALCILYASENTTDIFTRLMGITEKPWPNDRIVEEFDRVLNRGGSLTTTLKIYKGMYPLRLEAYRRLNRKRGLVSPVSR